MKKYEVIGMICAALIFSFVYSAYAQMMIPSGSVTGGTRDFGTLFLEEVEMAEMLLWWVGTIAVIILIIRWLRQGHFGRSDSPIEILKDRFARGEIGEKEFRERWHALRKP